MPALKPTTRRYAGWFLILTPMLIFLTSCAGPGARVDAPETLLAEGRLSADAASPLQRLIDPTAPESDRRGAALSLLRRNTVDTRLALISVLGMRDDPSATRAVVEAVLLSPDPPPAQLEPAMIALLLQSGEPIQADVAEALGRFNNPEIVRRLRRIANDENQDASARRGAIAALGYHRTKPSAETLIKLIDADQPVTIQRAAFDALANLSGKQGYGEDRNAWTDWWAQARRLNTEQWSTRLVENLAERDSQRRLMQQQTVQRLLESQRALYRTTVAEDRPAVLAYMLNDPIEPIRQLGMNLTLERLLEGLPFGEPLREALRARLTDPSSSIRQQAALRLTELDDMEAADIVADRLARDEEHVTAVLKAQLLLMARLPRAAAIEPALTLLNKESLRAEAAGALAAAAQAGLLSPVERERARASVRRSLRSNRQPAPQVVSLLGKVGQASDWERIAGWVDSPDAAVKRAAAQAWAESDRSLKLLAERVTDPVIQPIVISAATRRGEDPFTLLALVASPPDRPQVYEAWRRALTAMSGRVPSQAVLQAVSRLALVNQPAELREQMLSEAIANVDNTEATAAERILLRLDRADTRLAMANAAGALADYQIAGTVLDQMTPIQRDRYFRGAITASLKVDQVDEAFAIARELLGRDARGGVLPPTDDPVIDQFIEQARVLASRQRNTEAQRVLTELRLLMGPAIKPEVSQRIALLEAELNSRTAMPANAEIPSEPQQP